MQEFYKGRKDRKFVYASYFACHTVKGSVISKRGSQEMHPHTWFYIPTRRSAILRSFDSFFLSLPLPLLLPAMPLYFQFRGFIVALAPKYKLLIQQRRGGAAFAGRVQY